MGKSCFSSSNNKPGMPSKKKRGTRDTKEMVPDTSSRSTMRSSTFKSSYCSTSPISALTTPYDAPTRRWNK